MPLTLGGDDSVSDEFDDFTHIVEQEVGDEGVVIARPIPKGLVALVVSLVVVSSTEDGPNIMNLTVSDAPPS